MALVYGQQLQASLLTAQQQQQQTGGGNAGTTTAPTVPSVWAKFEKGDKIGEGTYGWVYHARSKENGGGYAIKQFKGGREGDGISPTAIREIMLLRELRHENIVRLESVHISRAEASLWLAFDYAEHDLYEMIKFHRDQRDNRKDNPYGLMPQYVVKTVMWQLLNGLNYMHQHWVLHRDLKPSNVLVMADDVPEQQGQVKIADFGLARIFQAPLRPLSENGVVVTIWYRAPELLLGARHYTRAVDVWAAGCIFAELLMLRPLFQGTEKKQPGNAFQSDQVERIFRVLGLPSTKMWPDLEVLPHWHDNTDNVRVRKPEYGSPGLEATVLESMRQAAPPWQQANIPQECKPGTEAFRLLSRMLDYNPATRITAEEALEHPYFKQEPRPGPNTFKMPGAKSLMVRYPRRPMTIPQVEVQPQPAAQGGGQATGAPTGGRAAAGLGGAPQPGSRAAGGASVLGKKRKQEPAPGFR